MVDLIGVMFTFCVSKPSQSTLCNHWTDWWFQNQQFFELGTFLFLSFFPSKPLVLI